MKSGSVSKTKDFFSDISLPDLEDQKVNLEKYVQQGIITPEEAQTYLQQNSGLNSYQEDPTLKSSQLAALNDLQNVVDNDGADAQSKAQIADILGETQSAERGSREAILSDLRSRGMGGSGAELAAQLSNQQASSSLANKRALEEASIAQQRKMEALNQLGTLGGNIRNQDFTQAEAVAKAQDSINQFNTQNKQNTSNLNVQNRNDAQTANLNAKQNVANSNTDLSNQQQQYNKQLLQQQYENQLKKASGQSGVDLANVNAQNAKSANDAAMQNAFIGGAIQAGASAYRPSATASDVRVKENIEPFDSEDFLNSITGYKYTYKNPKKHGEGPQVGPMAQDVQKKVPQAVSEDEEGVKRVDYTKLGGPILAALSDINERLKKVEE